MKRQAIILAGGKGTRLRERLKGLPKPLVDVCGVPLLERQIHLLQRYGFSHVLILVNHAAEQIVDFCSERENWGLDITCIDDGEPRGTAGATLAIEHLLAEDFLVVYGDTLLEVDLERFLDFHKEETDAAATLLARSGARQTILHDADKDGKLDVIALMAQSQEQIVLLKNLGDGKFSLQTLLSFSPLHGLSHMELKDMDGDGDHDLLVSNGDNWDFSPIRKPYHGVRIFLNDGQFKFKQAAFFPLPGASKAMAVDFDGDGDLDIAAISFYDDPDDPIHGFLLLENKGGLQFDRHLLTAARTGKWLTMECADIDADGRTDIILGSYFHNPLEVTKMSMKGITDFPQLLILKNHWKQK